MVYLHEADRYIGWQCREVFRAASCYGNPRNLAKSAVTAPQTPDHSSGSLALVTIALSGLSSLIMRFSRSLPRSARSESSEASSHRSIALDPRIWQPCHVVCGRSAGGPVLPCLRSASHRADCFFRSACSSARGVAINRTVASQSHVTCRSSIVLR
jgi:hypothetical protein